MDAPTSTGMYIIDLLVGIVGVVFWYYWRKISESVSDLSKKSDGHATLGASLSKELDDMKRDIRTNEVRHEEIEKKINSDKQRASG